MSNSSAKSVSSVALPEYVFDPQDSWTQVFQKGLYQGRLSDKFVYEVGVGSGTNVAFLLNNCLVSKVAGSDIDSRLVRIASASMATCAPEKKNFLFLSLALLIY